MKDSPNVWVRQSSDQPSIFKEINKLQSRAGKTVFEYKLNSNGQHLQKVVVTSGNQQRQKVIASHLEAKPETNQLSRHSQYDQLVKLAEQKQLTQSDFQTHFDLRKGSTELALSKLPY